MLEVSSRNGRTFAERLRAGEPCYSLGIRTARSVDFVRMAATCGYDTIWIDLEHSTIPLDTAAQMTATARDLGLEAWVRVPEGDFGVIGRVLDGGASGVIVPQIETAEDARKAVSYCRYPPEGGRSQNALYSTFGFRRIDPKERVETANRTVFLQLLLESSHAIDNIEAIAAVEGVDAVGLGLNDLSANLNMLGNVRAAAITALCRRVIAAAKKHGKLVIIGGLQGPDHYRELVDLGAAPYVFAAIDTDLFVDALDQRIAKWRAAISA
ncbi:HpcH/HpaI aldolase family protein [Ensifer canadensis]